METCAGSRLVLGEFQESKVIAAAAEALEECGGQPTCGFLFVSASWLPQIHEVLDLVRLHGRIPLLVGSLGAGLIGRGQEAEGVAGMSLLLLSLPETKLTPILISNQQIEASTGPGYWLTETGLKPEEVDSWIVLANPYAPNLERWLVEWNVAFPDTPCIGGLASGSSENGENALVLDGSAVDAAVVALAVKGGKIRTIVSQGCKPVGEPFTITHADENLVYALGSRPAYEVLSETFNGLSDDEKERARGNLFAGLAASEYVADLKRGDFLVRNLLGADPQTGAVAIGARARTGQTLQYQLRDKITAHADLVELAKINELQGCTPFASLVFSCNGR
ncbi:MAG: FIST N-terminal domain-containing protein, partial [Chthoniobacterales bacterium]